MYRAEILLENLFYRGHFLLEPVGYGETITISGDDIVTFTSGGTSTIQSLYELIVNENEGLATLAFKVDGSLDIYQFVKRNGKIKQISLDGSKVRTIRPSLKRKNKPDFLEEASPQKKPDLPDTEEHVPSFHSMYDRLKISGFRATTSLNKSMEIALKALDDGRGFEKIEFSYNLSLGAGNHTTRQHTPVEYLRLALPTYKYKNNRLAATELLERLKIFP